MTSLRCGRSIDLAYHRDTAPSHVLKLVVGRSQRMKDMSMATIFSFLRSQLPAPGHGNFDLARRNVD